MQDVKVDSVKQARPECVRQKKKTKKLPHRLRSVARELIILCRPLSR